MQQRDTSGYNLWVPEAIPGYYDQPIVQAPYYAQPYIADFISYGGRTSVANIDLDSDIFSAYAAYEDGFLSRIALVNFEYWTSDLGDRPTQLFSISASANCIGAKVEFLTAPEGALASSTLTWSGIQWSYYAQNGVQTTYDTQILETKQGQISVEIPASSAAIVFLTFA